MGKQRRVRCSVPSFASLAPLIEGTSLLAAVPERVARDIQNVRPRLRMLPLPFKLGGSPMELLWPKTGDDDESSRYLRGRIVEIAKRAA